MSAAARLPKPLRRYAGYAFVAPYVILFAAWVFVPLAYSLGLSMVRWELASIAPPRFIGFGNYAEAFSDDYFWKALWATVRFTAWTTPLCVTLSLLAALALDAVGKKRASYYRAALFVPTMLTITVAGILWRWFYNSEFGLFNELLGPFGIKLGWISDTDIAMKSIVLMTLWWTMGAPIVILFAGLKNLPSVYYEAARVEGAGPLQRLRHITIPLLRPILLFVVVTNLIGSFQVFGQTFIITRGGPELSTRVLVQYIYETAFTNYRMGYGAALSWLLFLMVAMVTAVVAVLGLREPRGGKT